MGAGGVESEPFAVFAELVAREYLLARDHADAIHSLVAAFADSGLPCFHFPETLRKLWNRMRVEDGDLRACRFIRAETLAAASSRTTILYDGIQKLLTGIHSEAWQ